MASEICCVLSDRSICLSPFYPPGMAVLIRYNDKEPDEILGKNLSGPEALALFDKTLESYGVE